METYTIVMVNSADSLNKQVNEKIREGWKPQGGIEVTSGGDAVGGKGPQFIFYYQAMIKP